MVWYGLRRLTITSGIFKNEFENHESELSIEECDVSARLSSTKAHFPKASQI